VGDKAVGAILYGIEVGAYLFKSFTSN